MPALRGACRAAEKETFSIAPPRGACMAAEKETSSIARRLAAKHNVQQMLDAFQVSVVLHGSAESV